MDHLPNEILGQICSQLTEGEIINLPFHLSSRGLSKKNARLRFHHLFSSLDVTRLKQLVRIAANPSIRDAVIKITFWTARPDSVQEEEFLRSSWLDHMCDLDPDSFFSRSPPTDLSFDNFHTHFGKAESKGCVCHNLSLEAQFIRCNLVSEAWIKWQSSGQDVSLLALAVARLPNLRTICIDNHPFMPVALYNGFAYSRVMNPLCFLDLPYWQSFRNLWGSRLLERLVKATSAAQRIDHSFRTKSNKRPSFYKPDNVYLMLGDLVLIVVRDAIQFTFEDLVSLEMTSIHSNHKGLMYRGLARTYSGGLRIPITFFHRSLPEMMEAPNNLRSIAIGVRHASMLDPYYSIQVFPLLPLYLPAVRNQCPILRLELVGFSTSEARLSRYLQAAVQPLRHLRLDKICINRGTWVGLFDQLGGEFDLTTLKFGFLTNTGEDIEAITGQFSPNILVMNHKAEENLLNWLRGEADFHCVRLLMS